MELKILPAAVHAAFFQLPRDQRDQIFEIRFRMDRPVTVLGPEGESCLKEGIVVSEDMLEEMVNRATGFSPYALKLEETGLYLPLPEGGRMGLCGEVVMRDDRIHGVRRISSISLRLARQITGVAGETAEILSRNGYAESALILSPPGEGKTTFLRDLIRCMSLRGFRVSVADERRELSAMTEGRPNLDLGPFTDVLCGCPKARAMSLLIRAMNPQILAVDELGGAEEVEAALYASFSGVALLATAHGRDRLSLRSRPMYRDLLDSGAFSYLITLARGQKPKLERLVTNAQTHWRNYSGGSLCYGGAGCGTESQQASAAFKAAPPGPGDHAGRDGTEYASRGGSFSDCRNQNRR